MRRSIHIALLLMLASMLSGTTAHAQTSNVGIGTTSPDASALLDLTSLARGLLVPRLTEAQKLAIASPATGLLIYETDNATVGAYAGQTPTFWYYNGTTWIPFVGAGWLLLGNAATNASVNFIGTKDSMDWVIRTNSNERARVFANGNFGLTNTINKAEEFRFYQPSGMGSLYSGFKAGINLNSYTLTWPPADGNGVDYILCTNGFGQLNWKGFGTAGGGGLDTFWSRGTGRFSLIGHGLNDNATGDFSITDGVNNSANGEASVVWGESNQATGFASIISGGNNDTATGDNSTIGGGGYNKVTASYSSVVAGQHNTACGPYAIVVGGNGNTACGSYSVVLGGTSNNVSGDYSLAFGVGAAVTQSYSVAYYGGGTPVKVGIGTVSPAEALDAVGNFRFSGAMMPNGLPGTPGYVFTSAGAAPETWTQVSSLYWSTLGNTGTTPPTQYVGTIDAKDFVFKTNATERMRILSTGNVGINITAPTNQLHVVSSSTTDEVAAIVGQTTAATTNQAVGVWGAASNASGGNTGTIGVLATGNGSTGTGSTNVALQINSGEFAMGRTTEAPTSGTVVEGAASGTSYSAQGPSGVVELTLGGGNLTTVAPTTGVFQNLGVITINNRYCTSTSIVIVNIVSKSDDGVTPDCKLAEYFADVDNRTGGAFDLRIGMIPTTTSLINYTTSDKIRVSYVIVNPSR